MSLPHFYNKPEDFDNKVQEILNILNKMKYKDIIFLLDEVKNELDYSTLSVPNRVTNES